jgi:photosynthetic reaction center H subunit
MITDSINLASLLMYVFWFFFAGLIWYLHRENKREGYPLVSDRSNSRVSVIGYPAPPPPKTFLLAGGKTVTLAGGRPDQREIKVAPAAPHPGAPFEPTGDPMADGVGPASYAEREDHPDMTHEGDYKIVPLRAAPGYFVETRDPNPIGMNVKGADGLVAGVVTDVWVDRSEYIGRYFEVDLGEGAGTVLLPWNFARVDGGRREIRVKAIYAKQFAGVPRTRHPDRITLLEEDRICGYFGGGYLYADPSRAEPLV